MNCLQFEQQLDELDPAQLSPPMRAHAAGCERCARALATAIALDAALGSHFSATAEPPGAGLVPRVLERVEAIEARRARLLLVPDVMPWWVRATAEPGVALASAVIALLLWQGETLIAFTRAAIVRMASGPAPALPGALPALGGLESLSAALKPLPGADWAVAIGLACGLAPLFALAGWALWRACERLVGAERAAA